MGDTVKSSAKTWCAARVQFAPPPPLLFFPRVHLTNFCTSHDSGQPAWAAPPRPTARTRIALTTPRAVALAISRVACLGGRGNPVSHYPPLGSLSPQPAPHARGGGACFGQRDYETGWWGEGGGGVSRANHAKSGDLDASCAAASHLGTSASRRWVGVESVDGLGRRG